MWLWLTARGMKCLCYHSTCFQAELWLSTCQSCQEHYHNMSCAATWTVVCTSDGLC